MTLTCVTVVTAMTMIAPLLVDLARDFGISVAVAGQLGTATALPWAITALVAGPTTDRFGRRAMLATALVGLGTVNCLSALAPSFGVLLALRVLMGIVGGAAPTAMLTVVGDHVPVEQRGSAMGWVFAGFGIAAVVGVPTAGALGGAFGWRWALALVGLVVLGVTALVWRFLPVDVPRAASGNPVHAYTQVLRTPGLLRLLFANTGERVAYVGNTLYLPPFLMQTYGLSAAQVAPALAAAALGAIAGNVVGGRIADRVNRPLAYATALVTSIVFALPLFLLPGHLGLSTALAALFGLANGASRPAFQSLASEASTQHRGTAMGLVSCSSQVGWASGAALGGIAIAVGGYGGIGMLAAVASLYAAGTTLTLRRGAVRAQHGALPR
ncbi:MAG: MFS transporter [Chloroflexi bacterium]|nr:MFS transporter [Chloroflexota bacterium]